MTSAGKSFTRLGRAAIAAATLLVASATVSTAQDSEAPLAARQFGAWLDDASTLVAGQGQMTIALGRWSTPRVSQTSMPIVASGLGVSDRLQLNASVPFYRLTVDGTTAGGVDNMYIGAKYNVVDPTISLHEVGVAVGTVVEVLTAGAAEGRVHFVLPVNVELRRGPFRWYGSAGYFSRGAFFTGGAIEWSGHRGMSVTASMTESRSVHGDLTLDALSIADHRVDVSGGAAYPVANLFSAFVNVARSVSGAPASANPVVVSGGLTFWFRAPAIAR